MNKRRFTAWGAASVLGLTLGVAAPTVAFADPQPEAEEVAATAEASSFISVAGNFQAAAGCSADWQPECTDTQLMLDPASGLYFADITLPAGTYEYKVTDGSWDTNWGQWGNPGGDNIPFTTDGSVVHFVFNVDTGESVAANNADMVTVPGSYQDQVGCSEAWMPACLATAMFPQEDGTYKYSVAGITTGTYEAKVAKGMAWGNDWGEGGSSGNMSFFVADPNEVVVFTWDPATKIPTVETSTPPTPGVGFSQAIWLNAGTVAWPVALSPGKTAASAKSLVYSLDGWQDQVRIVTGDLEGDETDIDWRTKSGYIALRLEDLDQNALDREVVQEILRGPIVFSAVEETGGDVVARTATQIAGVLDDVYAAGADADLGVVWDGDVPTLRLWAPTAEEVTLALWKGDADTPEMIEADWDNAAGTWTVAGQADWANAEYLWNVEVYVESEGEVVTNVVTDPYSKGLTVNSIRSVIVDMTDPAWVPDDWAGKFPTALRNESEQTIYELHVRDFSIWDMTVSEANRGSYMAFTETESDGMTHLAELSNAGLTTVHLLPTFDIATTSIPELREDQKQPYVDDIELVNTNLTQLEGVAGWGPASELQQAAVNEVKDVDGFNWGYDPFHWGTPEGSYATAGNQDGGARNLQYREMVSALHDLDLHVVQDVVFNHTAAHGQADMSVLDKVVPGYYHRLSAKGQVETSTCCSNVATENTMAEKIMIDTLVAQAVDYHVDGFRFDLMGHHSLENMVNVRNALDELTLDKDGVDGKAIYLYGEGWDFGEVAGGALFEQATQTNIAGSDIGAFNDRLRDAVRGGGPFDENMSDYQGFGTGQYTDDNGKALGTPADQKASLLHNQELIMVGLAGSLKDYEVPTQEGMKPGKDVLYNGAPAGYTASPQESVNYVEAHDNETLFDNGIFKLNPESTMDTRVRMQVLSNATVILGQSPAFLASGTELLRSKSLDRDSYNSGDWFNSIDWTMEWNTFAKGLPIKEKNGEKWNIMKPFLEHEEDLPVKADMEQTNAMLMDFLSLRASTPLFTLGDADLIKEKLTFPNAGKDATPGVIVMAIDDEIGSVDDDLDGVLVVFNATPDEWSEAIDGMDGREFELSEIQQEGNDEVVKESAWDAETGTVTVPARTVAVFTEDAEEAPEEIPDASIEVDPASVVPGSEVNVTGKDWLPGKNVKVSLVDPDGVVRESRLVEADADGLISTPIQVPTGADAGSYTILAESAFQAAEAELTVEALPEEIPVATLKVDPNDVYAGGEFTVSGEDWLAGNAVVRVVDADGNVLVSQTVTVGADGKLSGTVVMPEDAVPGNYTVEALNTNQKAEANLKVSLQVIRLAGSTRYDTNYEVVKATHKAGQPVFIATGADYADALSVAPAAAKEGGSLLLTSKNALSPKLVSLLKKDVPSVIYIVGGKGAVSAKVEAQLEDIADVERISGKDRYQTSLAVFDNFFAGDTFTDAFVATGLDFPDALSASAAAGALESPVLLVNGKTAKNLLPKMVEGLDNAKVKNVNIVGGTGAVNKNIATSLTKEGFDVKRLSGANRYATNMAVNKFLNAKLGLEDVTGIWLATGQNFPDALSAATPAGSATQRLVLSSGSCIPKPVVSDWIKGKDSHVNRVTLVGGKGALSNAVFQLKECKG